MYSFFGTLCISYAVLSTNIFLKALWEITTIFQKGRRLTGFMYTIPINIERETGFEPGPTDADDMFLSMTPHPRSTNIIRSVERNTAREIRELSCVTVTVLLSMWFRSWHPCKYLFRSCPDKVGGHFLVWGVQVVAGLMKACGRNRWDQEYRFNMLGNNSVFQPDPGAMWGKLRTGEGKSGGQNNGHVGAELAHYASMSVGIRL